MSKNNNENIPMPNFSKYMDTYIKLASNRSLFICEEFSDKMASDLSAMLFYLNTVSSKDPINLYIHSDGGALTGFNHIYDVMQIIKCPIKTICIGKCYSAGALLLAAGSSGHRYAFKNSNIMIHGIQAGFPIPGDDITDSETYLDFLYKNNKNIMKILAKHTGHTVEKIEEDCKQDIWMDSKTALEYGIIDHIIE